MAKAVIAVRLKAPYHLEGNETLSKGARSPSPTRLSLAAAETSTDFLPALPPVTVGRYGESDQQVGEPAALVRKAVGTSHET
jgi:hypothetical protein